MKMKPISTIHAELGIEPNGKVEKFLLDTCVRRMDKYIPKDTGMLRVNISKTGNSITYLSPYAHAQYVGKIRGKTVMHYTTPGTGPYWDKRMWSAEKQNVIDEVQNYVNR